MVRRFINVSTQREFIHQYLGAPEEVIFLRNPHRHMLHINVEIEVFTDDRDIEFILFKRTLESMLDSLNLTAVSNRSCEMVGQSLLTSLRTTYGDGRDITISVYEDGENGAIIKYYKEDN